MINSADPDQLASSHCLQRQDISRFSRTRIKILIKKYISIHVLSIYDQPSWKKKQKNKNTLYIWMLCINLGPTELDIPYLCKQCRSKFFRSQLIWIYTVWHYIICELVSTTWIKRSDRLKINSGQGILIYSAWQGLITVITLIPLNIQTPKLLPYPRI